MEANQSPKHYLQFQRTIREYKLAQVVFPLDIQLDFLPRVGQVGHYVLKNNDNFYFKMYKN